MRSCARSSHKNRAATQTRRANEIQSKILGRERLAAARPGSESDRLTRGVRLRMGLMKGGLASRETLSNDSAARGPIR